MSTKMSTLLLMKIEKCSFKNLTVVNVNLALISDETDRNNYYNVFLISFNMYVCSKCCCKKAISIKFGARCFN